MRLSEREWLKIIDMIGSSSEKRKDETRNLAMDIIMIRPEIGSDMDASR